jgi:hypothetical protein
MTVGNDRVDKLPHAPRPLLMGVTPCFEACPRLIDANIGLGVNGTLVIVPDPEVQD